MIPGIRWSSGKFNWKYRLWQSKSLQWYLHLWWSCCNIIILPPKNIFTVKSKRSPGFRCFNNVQWSRFLQILFFFQEWMIGQLEPGRSLRECLYYLVSSILETLTFDFCLFHSGMMGRDSVSCDQQLEDQQWVVESRRFQSMSYHVQNKFQIYPFVWNFVQNIKI